MHDCKQLRSTCCFVSMRKEAIILDFFDIRSDYDSPTETLTCNLYVVRRMRGPSNWVTQEQSDGGIWKKNMEVYRTEYRQLILEGFRNRYVFVQHLEIYVTDSPYPSQKVLLPNSLHWTHSLSPNYNRDERSNCLCARLWGMESIWELVTMPAAPSMPLKAAAVNSKLSHWCRVFIGPSTRGG